MKKELSGEGITKQAPLRWGWLRVGGVACETVPVTAPRGAARGKPRVGAGEMEKHRAGWRSTGRDGNMGEGIAGWVDEQSCAPVLVPNVRMGRLGYTRGVLFPRHSTPGCFLRACCSLAILARRWAGSGCVPALPCQTPAPSSHTAPAGALAEARCLR